MIIFHGKDYRMRDGVDLAHICPRLLGAFAFCLGALAVQDLAYAVALSPVGVQKQGSAGVDGLQGPAGLALSPDGKDIYVASVGGAVAHFTRDVGSGALQFGDAQLDGVDGVTGLRGALRAAVSPDGAHVYVCGLVANALSVFSRDHASGRLTFRETITGGVGGAPSFERPFLLSVSADGEFVYLATQHTPNSALAGADVPADRLLVFRRDAATGVLTWLQSLVEGENGVFGLAAPGGLAVSPDGQHLYVASAGEQTLTQFTVDRASGKLAAGQTLRNNVDGAQALAGASAIALSPDGRTLYVAAAAEDKLGVYARDVGTGRLSFLAAYADNTNGIDGLDGVLDIAVDPDGERVYAAGGVDDAIAVFSRNVATGTLRFIEAVRDASGTGRLDNIASMIAAGPLLQVFTLSTTTDQLVSWAAPLTDLTLIHTLQPQAPRVGETLTWDFTVTNVSGVDAHAVSVVAQFPASLGYIGATGVGASASPGSGSVMFDYPLLAPGAQMKASVSLRPLQEGVATLQASAGAAEADRSGGNNRVTAEVDVQTAFVNTPPVTQDDSVLTLVDTPVIVAVLQNDSDADGNPLAIDAAATPQSSLQGGLVAITGDGSLRYSPPAGFAGTDRFSYGVTDHLGGEASAIVNVIVNSPPMALDEEVVTLPGVAVLIDPLLNDYDPEGNVLQLLDVAIDNKLGSVENLGGSQLQFTPNSQFHGRGEFSYRIGDGVGGEAIGRVAVVVNTPPAFAEGHRLTVTGVGGTLLDLLSLASDSDGDTLSVLSFDAAVESELGTLEQTAEGLRFTPAVGARGEFNISFAVGDAFGGQVAAQVTVAINSPPLPADDEATTLPDTVATILVLFNDVDPDAGDTVHLLPEGTDSVSALNGSIAIVETEFGQPALRYTPARGYQGEDRFLYSVADSFGATAKATVTVTVVAPADADAQSGAPTPAQAAATPNTNGGGSLSVPLIGLLFVAIFNRRRGATGRPRACQQTADCERRDAEHWG
jgi:uncharacterized repeat protein (TIGR01451 family)